MFQISKIMPHCYSTVSNMRRYRHQYQKKFCLFYLLFSLLPTHISLSSSATSLLFGLHLSRCSLFLSHSHFFYLSLSSSLVLTLLRRLQATVVPSISPGAATHRSHPHSTPPHLSLSLSLFLSWCLVVLIVGGWLILVDGGRLIGLWVCDLGWV